VTDHEAIRSLLARYAQLLDDGQFEEWAGLFTPDAVFAMPTESFTGRDTIRRWIEAMKPPDGYGKHLCFNSVIALGAEEAHVITDFVLIGPDRTVASMGRYRDDLVLSGDTWRIAVRAVEYDATAPGYFRGDDPQTQA
jgi:uncharacterized protein (TIGR02246 family)